MSNYHRWGTTDHLWGDSGRLWGDPIDPATDPILYWMIEIDWANSGTYTGENEAKYCIDMETNAGRTNRLNIDSNGDANGIQMPAVGTARLVLDNTTRRFDPYNTGGALYGDILPGRYIKIRVTYHGVIYPVFHGNIIKITAQNGVNPTVTLDCEDGMRLLQSTDVNVSLSENVYMRNAIYQVLENIGWPSRFGYTGSAATTGGMTGTQTPVGIDSGTYYMIPYFSADGSAKERIKELCNAYSGNFWIDESGHAVLNHFASVWDVTPFLVEEIDILKDINAPMPWENIINVWKFYYYPKVRQAVGTIWQDADNTTAITAGSSIEIWAEYTFNSEPCQALGVIAPAATTDYTMNTASDGSGTDLTASFTVAQTNFGNKSKLVITNNSASTGYKTLLKIRGEAIANTNSSYNLQENDSVIAVYGRRTLTMKSPYCQTYECAGALFDYHWAGLATDERLIEIQIESRPDIQFDMPLLQGVDIELPIYGITPATTKIVGHKNHKWLVPNGQAVRTTILLEDNK